MKAISVMLVDDHVLMREAVETSLSLHPCFNIVASTGDVPDAIELATKFQPAIILLDINLPELSGFELIAEFSTHSPASRIIALSACTLPFFATKMMELGASGYITKTSSIEEMITAIQQVNEGMFYVCAEIRHVLAVKSVIDLNG